MFNAKLVTGVLISPIKQGANKLAIVSGYATPNMASWHIKHINSLKLPPIQIALTVGMCPFDGLKLTTHEGFKDLVCFNEMHYSSFSCQYVYNRPAVHSNLYIWLNNNQPFVAFAGSANYTQTGFSTNRREYIVPCDAQEAYEYYCKIDKDTITCNHAEVEEYIQFTKKHSILDLEESKMLDRYESITLSLLTRDGTVGFGSGINWGHRRNGIKREPNQAYIPLPHKFAVSGFFPLNEQHFTVQTDDGHQLILRVEQQNDKAITTPLNNSELGEYIRNRIGIANGAFIKKADLECYGRTDVTFYLLDKDEELYYMDFSV
jgi:hypothetical protein